MLQFIRLYLNSMVENMKIEYRETTNDLLKRIDIHSQYGARNIDEWMLKLFD